MVTRFADRILLGSDAPNTGCRVVDLIERVRSLGLDDEINAAVLGENALRLVPVASR